MIVVTIIGILAMIAVPKYIAEMPNVWAANYHAPSNDFGWVIPWPCTTVGTQDGTAAGGNGANCDSPAAPQHIDTVYVLCSHTDTKGIVWTNY